MVSEYLLEKVLRTVEDEQESESQYLSVDSNIPDHKYFFLQKMSTCDIYDKYEDVVKVADSHSLKSFGMKKHFYGYVHCLDCPLDNSALRSLLSNKKYLSDIPKLLVVNAGGDTRHAYLGDQLAKLALECYWEGIIVNGCIRDCREISRLQLGVLALGTNPRKTKKLNRGNELDAVSMFGTTFCTGDFVIVDEDGIIAFPTN